MAKLSPSIGDLRTSLEIDTDDIDRCLIEQPGLFYEVADAYALAVSHKDAVKLELEEEMASWDDKIRTEANENEEKVTEARIKQRLQTTPEVKELRRRYARAVAEADAWQALKEAYHQRSFMLRELVAIRLAELQSVSVERGARSARVDMADKVREQTGQMRRQRARRGSS